MTSGTTKTRRELLRSFGGAGAALALGGCIFPDHPPPIIDHVTYPIARIPWRRYGMPRGLFVGVASVDISPPPDARLYIAGFGFQRPMRGVRDPIFARCLYLDDGQRRVAIVVADVVGLPRPSVLRVRRLVGSGIEVAVAATHNHQAPDTLGFWGKALLYTVPYRTGIDPTYLRWVERRLAFAVKRAAEGARPARLFLGSAPVTDGLVRNLRKPGEYDRTVTVLEARSPEGAPFASLVSFACHPESLGDTARLVTADFPSVLRQRMETERGGVSVFLNGSLGGMVTPDFEVETPLEERLAFIDTLGNGVAKAALSALDRASEASVERVTYRRAELDLPASNSLFGYLERVGLIESRQKRPGIIRSEVGRIDVGPLVMALVPGEPTPAVGERLKKAMGTVGHPMVVGLANDELGYVLDEAEFDDPEYAYEVSVSLGRGTATEIEQGLARLGSSPVKSASG